MIYAVIDTNVLVSALLTHNPLAATAKILDLLSEGHITPVYNEDIVKEYQDVLLRQKFHFKEEKVRLVLSYISHYGIHSDRIPYDGEMPDEKDRPFYEVSLSMEDSFLVAGNLKHFPVTPKVISPADLITIIEHISSENGII